MKKLWMRAGISLMLSDEEIDEILGGCEGSAGEEAVVAALREGRFTFDGDSYIPQSTVEEFTKEHGLPYAVRQWTAVEFTIGTARVVVHPAKRGTTRCSTATITTLLMGVGLRSLPMRCDIWRICIAALRCSR